MRNQNMKRWAALILICVLLGALTTVAVSWGLVRWGPGEWTVEGYVAWDPAVPAENFSRGIARSSMGRMRVAWTPVLVFVPVDMPQTRSPFPWWSRLHHYLPADASTRKTPSAADDAMAGNIVLQLNEEATGWPYFALARCGRATFTLGEGDQITGMDLEHLATLLPPPHTPQAQSEYEDGALWAMPAALIPAGFAINTLFYAGIVLVLSRAPGFILRSMRARRRQCIWCGYDLRENASGICPECGAAAKS